MKKNKITLLEFTVSRFNNYSRDELFAMILCGDVFVNNEKILDPKTSVFIDSDISIRIKNAFVSRGGNKLDYVLSEWNIDVADRVFIDAGASTGGFTDCLLRHGARRVYSIDVGYNQLDFGLRTDPRVKVIERMNIMDCTPGLFDPLPFGAVCDLSFRSIRKAASHILNLIDRNGFLVSLVKPQFEWMSPDSGFNGVITEIDRVFDIVSSLISDLTTEKVGISEIALSPIRGFKGNRELFFYLKRNNSPDPDFAFKRLAEVLNREEER